MNTTWISIAIIVITVSMIAYPIAQLIPRPADKRRMLLRQAAIKLGFQIQIRTPKIDERMRPIYPKLSQSVGYYLALKNSAYTETCTAIKNQNDNQWLWLNQRFPPDQQMASITKCFNHLPPFIEAIEFNRSGITFFISENVMLIENINDLKIEYSKNCVSRRASDNLPKTYNTGTLSLSTAKKFIRTTNL